MAVDPIIIGLERLHGTTYSVERYWVGGRGYRYFYVPADQERPAYLVEELSFPPPGSGRAAAAAFLRRIARTNVPLDFPHDITKPGNLREAKRLFANQFNSKEAA